jgi:ABC-type multidrug transport system fused ATPase/permease subunit
MLSKKQEATILKMEKKTVIDSGPLGYIFVNWLTPLLKLGKRKHLVLEDLYELDEKNRADTLHKKFEPFWNQLRAYLHGKSPKPILWKSIFKLASWPLIVLNLTFLVDLIVSVYVVQFLIELAIAYLLSDDPSKLVISNGYGLAFLFFGTQILLALNLSLQRNLCRRIEQIIESSTATILYKKLFLLSPISRKVHSEGKIINMINNDIAEISRFFISLALIWSMPARLIFAVILLVIKLGPVSLISLLLPLLSIAATFGSGGLLSKTFGRMLTLNDNRIQKIREFLYGDVLLT